MYFGFVDDVTFSYNGANGPELKMTYMFRPVCLVAALWANSAVYDCILYLKSGNNQFLIHSKMHLVPLQSALIYAMSRVYYLHGVFIPDKWKIPFAVYTAAETPNAF